MLKAEELLNPIRMQQLEDGLKSLKFKGKVRHKRAVKKLHTRLGTEYWREHFGWQKTQKKDQKRRERKVVKKGKCPKTYKEYIISPFWKKRKNRYFQKYGKKCQICGSLKSIQVHHIIYKDLGFEKDKYLVGLCQSHHEQFHSIYGVQRDMTKDFAEFFADEKMRCEVEKR